MKNTFGFNDMPADNDLVNVETYISGLANFITKCQTPMTIAIQGDWGSGKTSAMKTLKRNLDKNEYWQIDFNTWQYSQFDLGDQLVFSLIGTILKEIESKIPKSQLNEKTIFKLNETGLKLAKVSKALFFGAGRILFNNLMPYGKLAIDAFDSTKEVYKNSIKKEEIDNESFGPDATIKLITDLHNNLEEIVKEIINAKEETHAFQGPNRIVIYIDDLDRLEPERAVTVMEAIKVFLDIPDCVFVLAIDFAVVLRGVRAKYGKDFSEEKARAFFDKIIQVPFNLPMGVYDVENLLIKGLKSINITISDDDLSILYNLLHSSVGRNPRSIKRLVNTFGLIKTIGDAVQHSDLNTKAQDIHIFAILCMQISYPEIFVELTHAQKPGEFEEKWKEIKELLDSDDEVSNKKRERLGIFEYCEDRFNDFIQCVENVFSDNKKNTFDIELFNDALAKSAVTSVGSSDTVQIMGENKGSVIKDMDTRYQVWLEKYPKKNECNFFISDLAKAFEEALKDILGPVEAGITNGGWWSYLATDASKVSDKIKGKRFLELYATKQTIKPQFGVYLSDEIVEGALKKMKDKFPSVECKYSPKSRPKFWFNNIKNSEQAKYAAKLIAEIYLEM